MSELTREEQNIIESCFRNFSDKEGNVNLNALIQAMENFGIERTSPVIFNLIESFAKENAKNKGVTYEDFVAFVNKKLQDKNSKETIDRIYELFIEGSGEDKVNFNVLRKVMDEIGEKLTDDEIKTLFQRVAKNGKDIDYDEFYEILTKKVNI